LIPLSSGFERAMALTFTLKIDLAGHVHRHSPAAHRATVAQMLDQAKQAMASGNAMSGDLTIAAPNTPPQTLGTWEFSEAGS
jgi:hypothetical protein